MTGSQELAKVSTSTDVAQLHDLEAILLGITEPPEAVEDPVAQAREIIAQILASETEADVEAFGQAIGWKELCRRYVRHDGLDASPGVPVELADFSWRVSEYEEGAPVYFIVRGTRLDDGSAVVLTTGSMNILAQLVAWARLAAEGKGAFRGKKVVATEAEKATKGGYWPMWLESVGNGGGSGEEEAAAA